MKKVYITLISIIAVPLTIVLTQFLVALIVSLLSYVPLLGGIIKFIFSLRGDSPSMLSAVLSIFAGNLAAGILCGTVSDEFYGRNWTAFFTGISVVLCGVFRLIMAFGAEFSAFSVVYGIGIILLGGYLVFKSSDL